MPKATKQDQAECVLPFEYAKVVAAVESMEHTPAIEARVGDLESSTIRYLTKENRYVNIGLEKDGDNTRIVSNHNSFEVKASELVEVARYIHESLKQASVKKSEFNPFRKVKDMVAKRTPKTTKKKAPTKKKKVAAKKIVKKATTKKGKKKAPAKAASRLSKPLAKNKIAAKPKAKITKKKTKRVAKKAGLTKKKAPLRKAKAKTTRRKSR